MNQNINYDNSNDTRLVKKFIKEVLGSSINLPKKLILDVSCQLPEQIGRQIYQFINNVETFVLFNNHVWRYRQELIKIAGEYPSKRFIIITANYDDYKFGKNYFEIAIPSIYWCRQISNAEFIPKTKNLNYGFSSLNNRPADHRLIFGFYLYKKKLLDDIIFVLNNEDCKYASKIDRTKGVEYEFNNARNFLQDQEFENFVKLLPLKFNNIDITVELFNINHLAYLESYSNIVLETHVQQWPYSYFNNLPVITEKSFKPFMASQIPLIFAACGHMRFLENLGFDVFKNLYPKDFDNLHLSYKIDALIAIISQGKEFIENFYFENIRALKHNYDLIMSDKIEKDCVKKLKNINFIL